MVSRGCPDLRKRIGSSNLVLVNHEFTTQPGVIRREEILDPVEDSRITLQGEESIKIPAESDFTPVTSKGGACEEIATVIHGLQLRTDSFPFALGDRGEKLANF